MHEAGQSAKEVAINIGHAVMHAYHGTATALSDTAITTKVKTTLDDDKLARIGDIHVTTVAGVVSLRGRVSSAEIATRAERIAEHSSGVKTINNHLRVASSGPGE
jgi:hyperosmotically inducible periplasmic protein